MTRNRLLTLLAFLSLGGIMLAQAALSQPVRDRVLSEVRIVDGDECALVTISFNFPIRYVRHFPETAGDELRIHLEPIAVNPRDANALFKREAIKPPPSEIAPLVEVTYEGDITGGPYLTLSFNHPVQFKVGQGSDFRSLVVAVPLPETSLPCEPLPGKGKVSSGR